MWAPGRLSDFLYSACGFDVNVAYVADRTNAIFFRGYGVLFGFFLYSACGFATKFAQAKGRTIAIFSVRGFVASVRFVHFFIVLGVTFAPSTPGDTPQET